MVSAMREREAGERIPRKERIGYDVQMRVGHLAFFVVGPAAVFFMRVIRGNAFEGIAPLRRIYREAAASGRPLIICANHLTMFDSIFLHYALATVPSYLRNFRLFSWNVPAVENFKRDPFLRVLTYVAKTIPIDRSGNAVHHRTVLDRIKYLASRGEIFTIFPEGGRSRTGRVEVERVASGVGNIVRDLERPLVLCVYMRSEQQESYGHLPPRGDRIHLRGEVISPSTTAKGVRAAKELSKQIIEKLRALEDEHFDARARAAGRDGTRPKAEARATGT
jgi:1-acyl-sn-glycerol-3-phosphate acyltransferase